MFTGLIADRGRVAGVAQTADGARISIATALAAELRPGDSLAVSGVCLTATEVSGDRVALDVMHQTLDHSTLGSLVCGRTVNLELAVRPADRLGGHLVQGHVDGIGRVDGAEEDGFARRVTVACSPELLRYVVSRGSVAMDGVSLTVAELGEEDFSVSLIPETLERTTLADLASGDAVNLEVDVLAKYVERLLEGVRG